ncbi:MAG: CHRD domain-containing protein [Bryobacteraceae bacterium]|nr:CHRD domain-containing protein [Bryobacteraceae bacterium]
MLAARNVVPPIASPLTGTATLWLRLTRDAQGTVTTASVDIDVRSTAINVTGLKLYQGPPNANGSLLVDLGGNRQASFPVTRLNAWQGPVYVTVATEQFPGGALRGQMEAADHAVLLARLSPGLAAVHVLATRDPRGRLTSAELTFEAATAGPIRLEWQGRVFEESTRLPFDVPMVIAATDIVAALLRAPAQVSLTLGESSGTESRGTLHGTDRVSFFPGPGRVTFHTLRNQAGDAIAALTVLDPHPTATGPVALSDPADRVFVRQEVTPNAPFATVLLSEAADLSSLNATLRTPDRARWNRVPLAARVPPPVAQSVISAVWDPRHRTIAPGGLFTVFGQNLAAAAGDLAGLVGTRVPVSLNGTSVMIGGLAAPVIDVRPTHVIAQAPMELEAGPQPVVVRTSEGASAPVMATVAPVAPAVFFEQTSALGNVAVVRKADGSAVSMENPARPNDLLVFFATGYGARTTPAIATGIAAPSANPVRLPLPSVTIGGRPAAVVYSVLVPGLLGIVQTAIRMPQAAGSGNLPLVVSYGASQSNPVILFGALR